MLNVLSHCSRVLVNRLPPPPMPALLNSRWILSVACCSTISSRKRSSWSSIGDVGDMGGDAQALRQPFDLAKPPGFRHRIGGDIAHRDIAALGDQLAREFAAHARAASGDDGDLSGKILHGGSLTFPLQYCEILVGAGFEPPTLADPGSSVSRLFRLSAQATKMPVTQMSFLAYVSRGWRSLRQLIQTRGRTDRTRR